MTLKPHPYAGLFPMIEGEAFVQFAADVKENGLREKIVLLDGLILDGRNRYAAAVHHGLPAADGDLDCFRDFDPETEGDPLKWVLSKNLARRHLNVSQLAMVADHLATMRQGERTDIKPSANLQKVDQASAALMLNVSTRSVASAHRVRETGSAELVALVEQGILPVSQGERAAKQGAEIQAEVVALAKEGKINAVRTAIKKAARNARETVLGAKLLALPDKKFGVILADPEWEFVVWSNITGLDRSAVNHYAVSPWEKISARDVQKIAAKDCALFLWVTDLERGLAVMRAWGFEFKSYFVWVKDIVDGEPDADGRRTLLEVGAAGTGYWNRDRDELMLVGTRGHVVAPAPGTQGESVWFAPRPKVEGTQRGRHSAKPEIAHQWIETQYPTVPKIELNARQARAGWDVWGYEAPAQNEPGTSGVEDHSCREGGDAADAGSNPAQAHPSGQIHPGRAREILARHASNSIPEPATEAAAVADEEPDASMTDAPGADFAGDAEAGAKCQAPDPAPLPPEAQAIREDRTPRWQSQFGAGGEPKKSDDVMEIPEFLRRAPVKLGGGA
jgi:N6-adenosine-specific RNA methylase IME4